MPKAPNKQYSKTSLDDAIKEVENNTLNLSVRQIAEKYGVPRSSLRHYLKNPGHKTSLGPAPILSEKEEEDLEDWIRVSARKGFTRDKNEILDSVQNFLSDNPRPNPFTDNKPGEGWWKGFLKRHPRLSIRASEGVTKASSCVSENDIRGWFTEIRNYAAENNLTSIFNEPDRIYNADETNFQLCSSTGQVLAEKGAKNVYNVEQSNSKEAITVLFTFSAAGDNCCPFIVYPYQRLPEKICNSIPDGWGIGRSDNGWMTKEVFYEYIANVLHPYLVNKGVQFPIILFVDGHKTHLNFHLSQLCSSLKIELIALYPNATRILQPADVAAFRPLKVGWRKCLKKWQSENQNQGVTKLNFASILKVAITTSIRPEILINGFRACGLCPFNPDAVDYTKCLGKTVKTTTLTSEAIPDLTSITYKDFTHIVGDDIINTFENCTNRNQPHQTFTQHLEILFRLWEIFRNNLSERDVIDTKEHKSTNTDWSTEVNEQTLMSKHVQKANDDQLINLNNKDLALNGDSSPSIIPTFSKKNDEPRELNLSTIQLKTPVKKDSFNICTPFKTPFKNDSYKLSNIPATAISSSDPSKHVPCSSKAVTEPSSSNIACSSKCEVVPANTKENSELPSPKILKRKCSLGEYLAYPETPVRKGKRKTERQPYAISSKPFKEAVGRKQIEKENAAKEKEERKIIRESKKKTKDQNASVMKKIESEGQVKVTENDSQMQSKDEDKEKKKDIPESKKITVLKEEVIRRSKTCAVCTRFITNNELTCSVCLKNFHLRCVPKQHKDHIPDNCDLKLYLCHLCYKIDDSDSTDSESSARELFDKAKRFLFD